MAKGAKKTCFLICPIGKDGTATRVRSNKVQKHLVQRVLEPLGYAVERADQLGEPGLITNQIIRKITECDLLVADLTEHNANVFYELAIRHGLKKPFIHIIDAGQEIPFDNANVRAIVVDLTDLDSVEDARAQLETQAKAIEAAGYVVESPISIAFELESLRASGKPDEIIMAQVLDQVALIRRELSVLREADRKTRLPSGRHREPATGVDVLNAVLRVGEGTLAAFINENLNFERVGPGEVVLSPQIGKDGRDVSEELQSALSKATGRPYKVIYVPF